MKKTVGFIGAGNMASAIILGMVSSEEFKGSEIEVFDKDESKVKNLCKKAGVTAASDNGQLIKDCSCIVLAVKPNALNELLKSVGKTMKDENTFVLSIAAGQSTEKLREMIGYDLPIVRVMPNVNALSGQAISGYTKNSLVTDSQLELAKKMLNCFGKSVEIDESLFSVFSAVAGCSPAYTYLFANALSSVGVAGGLTKAQSLEIVCDEMIRQSKEVKDLDISNEDLKNTVQKALFAAYEKDRKM
ncbi:MAG: pyrroline-5-carboxylate reductase [Clostridia bacterium]|nr:pyrroline-5-carboxylate reductase [Clostridia bacterium]